MIGLGLPVLASTRLAIWQEACISFLNACNISKYGEFQHVGNTSLPVLGDHDLVTNTSLNMLLTQADHWMQGPSHEEQRTMDWKQDLARICRSSY